MADWTLYIDESGPFDEADEDVLVAGVLLPTRTAEEEDGNARRAIAKALPHAPWPPHSWHVERAAAHFVWHEAGGWAQGLTDGWNLDRIRRWEHVAQELALRHNADWARLRDALKPQLTVHAGPGLFRRIEEAIGRADPLVLAELQEERTRRSQAYHGAIRGILERCGATVLVAAEPALGTAVPEARAPETRYPALLGCVISRAVDLVLLQSGTHTLAIRPLGRRVEGTQLLEPRHVLRAAANASGDRTRWEAGATFVRSRGDGALQLSEEDITIEYPVRRTRGHATPNRSAWPVVVDAVSNPIFRDGVIFEPTVRMSQLRTALLWTFGQARTSAGWQGLTLPSIAAGGVFFDEIRERRRQRSPWRSWPHARQWANDDAQAWVEVPW